MLVEFMNLKIFPKYQRPIQDGNVDLWEVLPVVDRNFLNNIEKIYFYFLLSICQILPSIDTNNKIYI